VALRSLYHEPDAEAAETAPALELIDVFKIHRSGPVETVALRGLDLRVEPGEALVLFGPSGSGKTTVLSLAAGLDVPSAGDVRAGGRSLARLGEAELAGYRAREVALVLQSDNLWPSLRARENLLLSLRLAGRSDAPDAAGEALDAFGLGPAADRPAGVLSGGEQQRVAIAAAAARRAPLVLADEPTGELDLANEALVLEALLRLRTDFGSTVLIVTHSPRLADAADRVVEVRDGRVVT
jgi:putative ABC transport system ATP-binding protein